MKPLKTCDHVLQEEGGINAAHYNAGLSTKERIWVQTGWRTGTIQVCCGCWRLHHACLGTCPHCSLFSFPALAACPSAQVSDSSRMHAWALMGS